MRKQILFSALILITFNVWAENLSQELKDGLIRGQIISCVPTIKKQMIGVGLNTSEANIDQYCGCLAHNYFDDFTKKEFDHITRTGELPERILRNRQQIQNECSSFLVTQKQQSKTSFETRLNTTQEVLEEALQNQQVTPFVDAPNSKRSYRLSEMLEARYSGKPIPEPEITSDPNEPIIKEPIDTSNWTTQDFLEHRYKTNPNYISGLDNQYKDEDVEIPEEKNAKQKYDKIYNACLLDKSSGVDMQINSLRRAVIDTCKSIAKDPSWLESLRYN